MLKFTAEELAEMAAADAEIERTPMTPEDYRRSAALDMEVRLQRMDNRHRKIAARQKAYYEANREEIAAYQKAYREANREKHNSYMREYMRKRRLEKKYVQAYQGPADPAQGQADRP